jgi:ATP-binding cassette subfamily B protein
LLTGELRPNGGSVIVDGVDRYSVSDEDWRGIVASSPQFYENYIFSNTFAFNLDPHSLGNSVSKPAYELCRELGLDELIEKMPSRELQMLGESGWQLSHGERSRIFMARSILQGARVLILDESFGALDPESLLTAMACVRRHARTLLVISHA